MASDRGMKVSWLDRLLIGLAPKWGIERIRARATSHLIARHFEAASFGRRTDNWHRLATDANAAASGRTLLVLRAQARDLVRNNPWARHGLRRLVTNTVGWGIRPKATGRGAERVQQLFKLWGESADCDATGRQTFYGLQRLVMRTVAESGEVLIRRRFRRPADDLDVPLQLQVLEPDYLDSGRNALLGDAGGPIIQGVEFDAIGRRAAYWLFDRHPGGFGIMGNALSPISKRIPADGILHVFDQERPGQVRGSSWFASVDVRLHDFHEFEDATLMKQKISACMAAFVTDVDGTNSPLGQGGTDTPTSQATDTFEPGMIIPLAPGRQVTVANPPQATDHQSFSASSLRGVAAGLGVTYEDLTGDYSQVNYSSARMSRLAHQGDIHDWRWNMLIPQFCQPVWSWMLDAMILVGERVESAPATWSPPPVQLLDPDKEGKANQVLVRTGQITWPQMVREQGEDPDEQLAEIQRFNAKLDRLGIVLDSDPRRTTVAGQQQPPAGAADAPPDVTDGGDGADGGDPAAANGAAH